MNSSIRFWRRTLVAVAVTLFAAGMATGAQAQGSGGPPGIDHYKVYRLLPPVNALYPVTVRDQFMQVNHVAREFSWFATPVMKDGFPLYDPILHYDWWLIDAVPFPGTVFATNQFGPEQELKLKQSRFLLLPSIKFPDAGTQVPVRNHYKCYEVDGRAPNRLVTLQDQFGFNQAHVDSARFFCNPAEKITPDGRVYPVVDPEAHLVCYRIVKTPPTPPQTILAQDQFGFWQAQIVEAEYLCVPSFKTGVVPVENQSWGSVKAIYR